MEQTLQVPEGKARLQVALSTWPSVDDTTEGFLASLHWRIRQCVILTHGQGLSREGVGLRLQISPRTVSGDLQRAYEMYKDMLAGLES